MGSEQNKKVLKRLFWFFSLPLSEKDQKLGGFLLDSRTGKGREALQSPIFLLSTVKSRRKKRAKRIKKILLPIVLTKASTKEPPHRHGFLCTRQAQDLLVYFYFLVFVRHWDMACLELDPEDFLPSAICVQRFGNWKVLQLIPLIALCCVLQRNRKPSHPSRHVVWAVHNRSWAAGFLFLFLVRQSSRVWRFVYAIFLRREIEIDRCVKWSVWVREERSEEQKERRSFFRYPQPSNRIEQPKEIVCTWTKYQGLWNLCPSTGRRVS